VKASARIVAEADGRGGTRLAVLRGESPLLLRRTGPRHGSGAITVHLVGGAAGPLRGDDLRIDVEVGPGARLDVRSVAASLAMPGKPGAAPSRLETRATVAAGGVLRWMPEPVIAVTGCHHLAATTVEVAAGGSLLWRDDLVCGRHGEASGDVRTDVTIRYDGAMLYRHELAIGPAAPGWAGAAVLGSSGVPGSSGAGDGRAIGSLIFAGADLPPARLLGGEAVLMPLAGPGLLATVIGADIRPVRAALDPLCADPVAPLGPAPLSPAPPSSAPLSPAVASV
jgi:urease accessory protein